ncbi:MAG: TonB-dependent receptor [bacterium]
MRKNKAVIAATWAVAALLTSGVAGANLVGRTRDIATGRPVRDVNIRLLESGRVITSDRHGEYRFDKLMPGLYHLLATHIAYDGSDTLAVRIPDQFSLDINLKPTPWVLNDVVVTGTRSPHLLKEVPIQTEVITRRDFERSGAKSVDEALSSAIGIQINEDMSGRGATIRGIEGDRVLVLVDGERSVGRVRGSIDLGQYSLTNVDKIEVIKGTGSTLYGSDAIGGVVNIITRRPSHNQTQYGLYGDFGSHIGYNPSAVLNYGNTDFGLTMDAKLYATDGFDLEPETPHTNGQEKTKRFNFNTKLRKNLSSKWNLLTSVRYMRERKDWFEYEEIDDFNKYLYNDIETNRRYDGSVAFDYLSGDRYSMKTRFFVSYYDHDFDKFNGPWWVDTSHTEDLYYEASYTSNYTIGDGHVVTYGLDHSYQDLRSDQVIDGSQADRTWSGYLQYEHTPLRGLNILPGLRYEHHSAYGGHVNPSINIMYDIHPQVKLRGFVGRGFRAPSIKQQYFVFDHTAAGYVIYGGRVPLPPGLDFGNGNYDDLTQETSITSSISAELSYGTIGLHRITYFYNHLEDLIEFTLIGFTPEYDRGVYIYQNVDRAVTQGIEWESRFRLSAAVDFSLSYDYLYTRDLVAGRDLVNKPAHSFKFNVSGVHAATGLGATFWGDYHSHKLWNSISNSGGNEGEPEYAPSRARLNLNLFKRWGQGLELFVRLNNILGKTRYEYGYWPGFEIFAGFKYDWQSIR